MFRSHIIEKLSSYIDNELSQQDRAKVDAHLEKCPRCGKELEQLMLVREKCKIWQENISDAGFDSSVRNKIVAWEIERGKVKMDRKLLHIAVPSAVLASLLLVTFLGNFYVKRGLAGRMSASSDDVGEQFSGYTLSQKGKILDKIEAESMGKQYEPYYAQSGSDLNAVRSAEFKAQIERASSKPYPAVEAVNNNQLSDGSIIVIQPVLPVTGEGEKVIRTGSINLEVENGKETYKQVSLICQEFGGYLATSKFYKDKDGRESGTIIMRIPKDKFVTVLDRFGALGKVKNINTDSQDVSREYASLKSQLDISMIVYNKMFDALQKRQNTISDAMRMESQLSPVLERIEELKNKLEYLDNSIALTTITVSFYEAEVSAKTLKESTENIRVSMINAAISAIKMLAKAIPVVIVVGLVVIILTPLVLVIKDWIVRLFKK